MPYFPTLIPDVEPATGFVTQDLANQQLNSPGIVERSGSLFAFFCLLAPPTLSVWKSSDAGRTWVRLDAGNEPSFDPGSTDSFDGSGSFDGSDTVIFATRNGLSLVQFDLAAETWGAPFGNVGAPSVEQIDGVFRRSNGDVLLVFWDRVLLPSPHWGVFVFSGGVWSAPFDLGTEIAALPGFEAPYSSDFGIYMPCLLDSSGILHVWMAWPTWNPLSQALRMFYVQFDASNSTSNFYDYPSQLVSENSISRLCGAAIVGNSVVASAVRLIGDGSGTVQAYVSVVVGSPISAPVWALVDPPGVDPGSYNVVDPDLTEALPMLATDGTKCYCTFVQTVDPTFTYTENVLRLCQATNPLGGWTGETALDFLVDPVPPGFGQPGQRLQIQTANVGSVLLMVTAFLPPFPPFNTSVFFLFPPMVSPVDLTGLRVILRGVKRSRKGQTEELGSCPELPHVKMAR